MNLHYYKRIIRPEHWDEFQKLIPEGSKIKKGDLITMEKQMSIEEDWEQAANKIAEKYEYYEIDEEDDDY